LARICCCRVESKSGRIRRVKYWQATLAILTALCASLALAEDFKTVNGKEYKNATVSRVEPDGIVLKTKSGITKVYFVELPKEVQKRFGYDPAALQKSEAVSTPTERATVDKPKASYTAAVTNWQAMGRSKDLRRSDALIPT